MAVIANIPAFTGTDLAEISVNDPGWVPSTTTPFGSAIIQKSEDFGARVNGSVISKGYLRTETPGSANQTVRGVVRYVTSAIDNYSYFGARISGGNWIGASLSSNPAKVQLVKCVNGTRTTVADPLVTVPLDTDHEIEMTVSGQSPSISVSIKFNGVEVVNTTLTESALNPAGSVGLFHRGASAVGNTTGPRFMSFYAADDTGADTTAPTLISPSATATGATTASGSVTTNEANGTLYYLASANATETDVTVKAGSSQAVTATGEQPVTITGLTATTPYYPHYLHRDAAGNDSAVASGAQFTTAAANTSPSFTGPNIADISGTEAVALTPVDVSAKFYDAESGLTFSAIGSWPAGVTVSSAGVISGTPTTAGTYASLQVRATDAGSLTADSNAFTITVAAPAVAGINVTEPLKNNTGTVLASQSGVRVAVLQAADLVSVYEATGLTSNASGILATISDAAITTGQQYHVAIKLADGSVGITGPITAS